MMHRFQLNIDKSKNNDDDDLIGMPICISRVKLLIGITQQSTQVVYLVKFNIITLNVTLIHYLLSIQAYNIL